MNGQYRHTGSNYSINIRLVSMTRTNKFMNSSAGDDNAPILTAKKFPVDRFEPHRRMTNWFLWLKIAISDCRWPSLFRGIFVCGRQTIKFILISLPLSLSSFFRILFDFGLCRRYFASERFDWVRAHFWLSLSIRFRWPIERCNIEEQNECW